jgi:hypothetical protein
MSEEAVAQLAAEGPWGDGEWRDVDPESVTYGMTREALSEEFELLGDFLQAAALAGHVNPSVAEGLVAALRAHQLFVWSEVADRTDPGVLGGVVRWVGAEASRARRMVVMVEGFISDLEQWAAATYRDSDDAKSGESVEQRLTLADEADLRARRARVRARLAEADEKRLSESRDAR